MRSLVRFADHLFVRKIFSERECDPDYSLFSKVEEVRQREYPDQLCLFVTQDKKDFRERVKRHPAFDNTIKLVVIDHCNSREINWIRAREVAEKLVRAFARIIERQARKGKITRLEAFRIIEKHFSK